MSTRVSLLEVPNQKYRGDLRLRALWWVGRNEFLGNPFSLIQKAGARKVPPNGPCVDDEESAMENVEVVHLALLSKHTWNQEWGRWVEPHGLFHRCLEVFELGDITFVNFSFLSSNLSNFLLALTSLLFGSSLAPPSSML
ncbi:hypothetical protein ACLOJK_009247 [Asimina triloba]